MNIMNIRRFKFVWRESYPGILVVRVSFGGQHLGELFFSTDDWEAVMSQFGSLPGCVIELEKD